jgi:hypothetical protein
LASAEGGASTAATGSQSEALSASPSETLSGSPCGSFGAVGALLLSHPENAVVDSEGTDIFGLAVEVSSRGSQVPVIIRGRILKRKGLNEYAVDIDG